MNTRSLSLLVLASLLSGSSSAISQQSAALSVSQPEFVTNRSPTPSENRSNHPLVTEDSSGSPAVAEGVLEPAPDLAQPVISPVHSTIQVNAHLLNLGEHVGESYHSTRSEILSSAGSFGDFTRFLQVLPGVVWNTDQSNDAMVRGGHPSENLYVVDGIEIPNINHIALEGTSGGFTSMIDTSSIDSVDMKAGVYDAKYSSRLSSLISIHTRDAGQPNHDGEINVGIAGAGGFIQHPFGPNGNFFVSGHRSLLNLATNNIGLNGTPTYTNGMARAEWSTSDRDHFSALSISGVDSININPCAGDSNETLDINTQYSGWRSTEGLLWQHLHSATSISTLTASYSAQNQNIGQQQQQTGGNYHNVLPSDHCTASVSTDIYSEKTNDGISNLSYGFQLDRHGWLFSAGTKATLTRMDYKVSQPVGEQSAFNASTTWSDDDTFNRNFTTGQTGTYAEAVGQIGKRWTAMLGAREETFALLHAHLFEPRASIAFRISEHQTLSAEYGRSAQLPPTINILSYAQNANLRPTQVEQYAVGADLWRGSWYTLSAQAYHKRYSDEPVSTEYPSLMLANMVDTLGQAFLWLPLQSGGRGNAQGLEMLLRASVAKRVQFLGSGTYARTRYAALDGVMRPGNYDVPLLTNAAVNIRLFRNLQLAMSDTYASGRPYTPFNIKASEKQFRGIYDLTRVNQPRGAAYNRLNLEINRDFHLHKGVLNLHGGVDNALDRNNFLGYAWLDRCPAGHNCSTLGAPMQALYQMPIFPIVEGRYAF
jgi:hypothetical protein